MIERLVFISTMVLFLMIGVNGFILMGNSLCTGAGTRMNLTDTSTKACGVYDSNQTGIGISNVVTDANAIQPAGIDTNAIPSTTTPGSAGAIINFFKSAGSTVSAASTGANWLISLLTAGLFMGVYMANMFPFMSPIIYIFVGIIAALEGFALMYWTMAGARAFLGRFL